MISGTTTLIAHLGYPTYTFKSPLIYNPWFEKNGVDAVVVPMGIKAEGYPDFFRSVFTLTNIRGALITMPHKVTTMELVDEISPIAQIAGATNAVLRRKDGSLLADQFDGAGFARAPPSAVVPDLFRHLRYRTRRGSRLRAVTRGTSPARRQDSKP